MAKKVVVKNYENLLSSLRSEISPVYFLYGEEVYLQDEFLNELYRVYSKKYQDGWNKYVYHAFEIESEQIISELVSHSLFSEPKIIVVKDLEELEQSGKSALSEYVKNPNSEITLVLMQESSPGKDTLFKNLKQDAVSIEVRTPWMHEMDSWLQYLLKQRSMQAASDVRAQMIDLAGESIKQLSNELEKIEIYLQKEDRVISLELLSEFIGETRTHSVFEFRDIMGTKSLPKILNYLFSLLDEGVAVSYIVKITADFYADMWAIKEMLDENRSDAEINKVIFGGRNLVWKYKKFISRYSYGNLRKAFPILEQADLISKTSSAIEAKNYLTAFYYELITPERELFHE